MDAPPGPSLPTVFCGRLPSPGVGLRLMFERRGFGQSCGDADMNCLPTHHSLALRLPRFTPGARSTRMFRVPAKMHVPVRLIVMEFQLEPKLSWLRRSFRCWLGRGTPRVPQWLRDTGIDR